MTKFEITIKTTNDEAGFTPLQVDKVEGTDLIQVLSQFMMIIVQIHKKHNEEILRDTINKLREVDDDIPF